MVLEVFTPAYFSKVSVTVEKVLSNGLKITLAGGLTGYIHIDMLSDVEDILEDNTVGSSLEARVLYVTPTLNTVMLTLRDVRKRDQFSGLSAGQLVEKAVISKVQTSHLTLKLGEDQWGVVSVRNMKEGKEVIKNVKKRFKEGGTVSTRILGLDYCQGVAVCSLHKALVSGAQRLDQLTIGEIVTVTVSRMRLRLILSLAGSASITRHLTAWPSQKIFSGMSIVSVDSWDLGTQPRSSPPS